jgi:hypothetical protein
MKNKITVCFFKYPDYVIKQVTIPGSVLVLLFIGIVAGMTHLSCSLFDYYHLKRNSANLRELEHHIGHQKNVICQQRNLIQKFTQEMDTLKSKLITLNQVRAKIRIIAGIDIPPRQDALFGVGGSTSENLASCPPPTTKSDNVQQYDITQK